MKTTINQNKNLIDESSDSFLPSKEEKTFDAYRFMKDHSQKEGVFLFLLIDVEREIGYISVLVKNKEQIDIGPMYIKSEFQGRGYGKKMVELLIGWVKQQGYRKIGTQTWGENKASRKIFESLDFKEAEVLEDTRVNGDSTIKYRYEI